MDIVANGTSATGEEYYTDSAVIKQFIKKVQAAMEQTEAPAELVEQLKPAFGKLLQNDSWLPEMFAQPYTSGGMGGGIGQYLLYRAADRSLTLFSLVVPPGSATPIHDHLAWGLVGVYRGAQREEVYRLDERDYEAGTARLAVKAVNALHSGEFYALLPPDGDIHRVETTSAEPSISIHLLGNDAGCILRHRFELDSNAVVAFRSGYSNRPCTEEEQKRSLGSIET